MLDMIIQSVFIVLEVATMIGTFVVYRRIKVMSRPEVTPAITTVVKPAAVRQMSMSER